MTVTPHPATSLTSASVTFLFPQLKIKLKGHQSDTNDVIEAGLQAILNTLTEHNLQDAFKRWQKCWEHCICAEGD
jgi:DNA-directed RNA polymerase subunit L